MERTKREKKLADTSFFLKNHIKSHNILQKEINMDTTKWKSVLVPIDVYDNIKKSAKKEGRTIGGQLRYIYSQYKSEDQKRVEEFVDAHLKRTTQ
jgi:hypothetical protein